MKRIANANVRKISNRERSLETTPSQIQRMKIENPGEILQFASYFLTQTGQEIFPEERYPFENTTKNRVFCPRVRVELHRQLLWTDMATSFLPHQSSGSGFFSLSGHIFARPRSRKHDGMQEVS